MRGMSAARANCDGQAPDIQTKNGGAMLRRFIRSDRWFASQLALGANQESSILLTAILPLRESVSVSKVTF